MDYKRLEFMFRKKHAPLMHAHKSRHTHGHHAHTHNLYAYVYTCTHYGHTGHLAKFGYDQINNLNFTNEFVWVRKGANPFGPKRSGY